MLIGELAKLTGSEVETIRYYEREQLLSAPTRGASGYRHYQSQHVGELNFILHCRSLGISLAEIRQLANFKADQSLACAEINQLIDRHLVNVQHQLESLQLLERQLKNLRQRCIEGSDAAHCGILQTLVQAAEGDPCVCHEPNQTAPK